MDHHFARSWLKSLSAKLESLTEWSWVGERQGTTQTHRQLFREFFSTPFQKTLALVDEQKKEEFVQGIEKNLYKFDRKTQQFPLGCLCALLQHGKDSPTTQERVKAWTDCILDRLVGITATGGRAVAIEVAEECLSVPFQRLIPLMSEDMRERLADCLGEHALLHMDEAQQKNLLEGLGAEAKCPVLIERIEALMATCTKELNTWLAQAPRFPFTPLALADALARAEHPLLRFFTFARQPSQKEAFLMAVALCLQSLRTRLRWMGSAEPVLERLSHDLQQRLFFVKNQGAVMEIWLASRLKKYNEEAAGRVASILAQPGVPKLLPLKTKLLPLLPPLPQSDDQPGDWVELDGPSPLADAVAEWLGEDAANFKPPQHTLSFDTLRHLLLRAGRWIEVDREQPRIRLAPAAVAAPSLQMLTQKPAPLPPPPLPPPALPSPTSDGESQRSPGPSPVDESGEVDNLIDLLMNEALAPVNPEMRNLVQKVSHGVYRISGKEVTLHTVSGALYVYRIGDSIKYTPIKSLLIEEGLVPSEEVAGSRQGSAPPVDTSSVARVAQISQQTASLGAKIAAPGAQKGLLPFGLGRPVTPLVISVPKADPQALISKRVEAATRAADVAKQVLRRQIDFEDEAKIRKLLIKGLKHEPDWAVAFQDFCNRRRVAPEAAVVNAPREFITTFVQENLPNSINTEWAQKVIHGKDKKEKKDKDKDKSKKDKKEKKKEKQAKREAEAQEAGAAQTRQRT
ncbi:unnamed protein product [Symbiodinium sp. CCMP2592]|nr:unnamed protein product [Symbiodinium sp. CCMP2592]